MAARLRLYLDTSVISAYYDVRDPVRQESTRRFWGTLAAFDPAVSDLVLGELRAVANPELRAQLLRLAEPFPILAAVADDDALVAAYIAAGAFSRVFVADARHVATAVLAGVPILASWNFRHLVNRTRRIKINLVNAQLGYNQIEIVSPPELE